MKRSNHCWVRVFTLRVVGAALFFAMLSPLPAASRKKSPFSTDCDVERARMKSRISEVLRRQAGDGSRPLLASADILAEYPIMATVGLNLCLRDGDTAFLKMLQAASVDHTNFLLANRDSDGDFLLEVPSAGGPIEDVGYNALFAIELGSLSRLCAEAGQPVDALFWYQGMKTVARRLVDATYSPDRGIFLSANSGGNPSALSALPVYLDKVLGNDIIHAVLRNYVLSTGIADSDLDPVGVDARLARGLDPAWALRSTLLLGALSHGGLRNEAAERAAAITEAINEHVDREKGQIDDAETCARYFACLIGDGGYASLVPRWYELEMLRRVGYMYGVLHLEERRQLDHDTAVVREFLIDPASAGANLEAVSAAMRGIYMTISAMRAEAKVRDLFNPRDRQQIPGFDIYAAFDELVTDVVSTLHEVENRVASASSGLIFEAIVESGVIARDQPVPVHLAMRSINGSVDISTVTMYYDQARRRLMDSDPPVTLTAGGDAKEFWFDFATAAPVEGTIYPVRFTVEVKLASKQIYRYHFGRSVYIRKALTFDVAFPKGNLIASDATPFDIRIDKYVSEPYIINTQWFSPSGLELIEGAALEVKLGAEANTTGTTLHIRAPKDCRPGAFPYKMTIYGNGAEKGTLSGKLFKHYHWLFVGPFGGKDRTIDATYAPERNVNLRASYEGAIRPISWIALPENAYRDNGELDLGPLVPQFSTSYLYTVVKTTMEKETSISLESTAPAVVFINGVEVLRVPEPAPGVRHHAATFLGEGRNSILIKVLSADTKRLFFQLGDEEDLTPDEYSNNLWELVDGYRDFHARSVGDVATSQQLVTLTYRDPRAKSVSVIGSFNGWSPDNTAMSRNKSGEWELSLHLLPGRYTYRFLIDDSKQVVDPGARELEPDGYGGQHSVLVVR